MKAKWKLLISLNLIVGLSMLNATTSSGTACAAANTQVCKPSGNASCQESGCIQNIQANYQQALQSTDTALLELHGALASQQKTAILAQTDLLSYLPYTITPGSKLECYASSSGSCSSTMGSYINKQFNSVNLFSYLNKIAEQTSNCLGSNVSANTNCKVSVPNTQKQNPLSMWNILRMIVTTAYANFGTTGKTPIISLTSAGKSQNLNYTNPGSLGNGYDFLYTYQQIVPNIMGSKITGSVNTANAILTQSFANCQIPLPDASASGTINPKTNIAKTTVVTFGTASQPGSCANLPYGILKAKEKINYISFGNSYFNTFNNGSAVSIVKAMSGTNWSNNANSKLISNLNTYYTGGTSSSLTYFSNKDNCNSQSSNCQETTLPNNTYVCGSAISSNWTSSNLAGLESSSGTEILPKTCSLGNTTVGSNLPYYCASPKFFWNNLKNSNGTVCVTPGTTQVKYSNIGGTCAPYGSQTMPGVANSTQNCSCSTKIPFFQAKSCMLANNGLGANPGSIAGSNNLNWPGNFLLLNDLAYAYNQVKPEGNTVAGLINAVNSNDSIQNLATQVINITSIEGGGQTLMQAIPTMTQAGLGIDQSYITPTDFYALMKIINNANNGSYTNSATPVFASYQNFLQDILTNLPSFKKWFENMVTQYSKQFILQNLLQSAYFQLAVQGIALNDAGLTSGSTVTNWNSCSKTGSGGSNPACAPTAVNIPLFAQATYNDKKPHYYSLLSNGSNTGYNLPQGFEMNNLVHPVNYYSYNNASGQGSFGSNSNNKTNVAWQYCAYALGSNPTADELSAQQACIDSEINPSLSPFYIPAGGAAIWIIDQMGKALGPNFNNVKCLLNTLTDSSSYQTGKILSCQSMGQEAWNGFLGVGGFFMAHTIYSSIEQRINAKKATAEKYLNDIKSSLKLESGNALTKELKKSFYRTLEDFVKDASWSLRNPDFIKEIRNFVEDVSPSDPEFTTSLERLTKKLATNEELFGKMGTKKKVLAEFKELVEERSKGKLTVNVEDGSITFNVKSTTFTSLNGQKLSIEKMNKALKLIQELKAKLEAAGENADQIRQAYEEFNTKLNKTLELEVDAMLDITPENLGDLEADLNPTPEVDA